MEAINPITQTEPKSSLSNKYKFVDTVQAVNIFEEAGYENTSVSLASARKPENNGYQKHLLRFRHKSFIDNPAPVVPEILLINSHSGICSFRLMLGFYRMACANGLICGDTLQEFRINHRGFEPETIKEAICNISDSVPETIQSIQAMQAKQLTRDQKLELADNSLALITAPDTWLYYDIKDSLNRLLYPRRNQDYKPDLFTVFNVIQEKILKGGRYLMPYKNIEPVKYMKRTRGIKSIDRQISVNKELFSLAQAFID
jgi:hypothetical protein